MKWGELLIITFPFSVCTLILFTIFMEVHALYNNHE